MNRISLLIGLIFATFATFTVGQQAWASTNCRPNKASGLITEEKEPLFQIPEWNIAVPISFDDLDAGRKIAVLKNDSALRILFALVDYLRETNPESCQIQQSFANSENQHLFSAIYAPGITCLLEKRGHHCRLLIDEEGRTTGVPLSQPRPSMGTGNLNFIELELRRRFGNE